MTERLIINGRTITVTSQAGKRTHEPLCRNTAQGSLQLSMGKGLFSFRSNSADPAQTGRGCQPSA